MRVVSVLLLSAATAIASPVALSSRWDNSNLNEMDFEIVNLARNLESLELNLWNQALNNFSDSDFSSAGYDGFRYYISLFRDQEIAHFTALNTAAGGGFQNCTYDFPVTSVEELLMFSQVVTSVGEGAFIGAAGNLTSGAARQLGAEIIGNEARQNSKLREESGLTYFNAINFDTALTASQAFSLAAPFFYASCPSSNPPINFKQIPALMAVSSTGAPPPYKAGDSVTVIWDSSSVYLGPDVHIQFLNDVYSLPADLTQTGDGMGTVTLPANLHGTAFIVATNFQGEGPIPDGQNFAIGYVVVT